DVALVQTDGSNQAKLLEATRDADALLVVHEQIDRAVIENLRHCRVIVRCGIGYDNLDLQAAAEHGIWAANVPDANYREVAVHAMAMILALTRRLPSYDKAMHATGWAGMEIGAGIRRPESQLVGLLGMGRIGGRVAEMARSVGYSVQVYDPYLDQARADAAGIKLVGLDAVIATSDIVSLHLPLTDQTRWIIDAAALARMKRGSFLVNVSRGGLVDEGALAEALTSGQLAGAGVDVWEQEPIDPDNPLLSCATALLSPHAAYLSVESFAEIRHKGFEEAARVLRGEPPLNPVNRP
ncbi:MAG: C-terminal binding protein, partial [Propionibacteriaceae bacterium]|nr:C-terminal binding protein [Propionibacteriaceae bacterium]